LVETGSKMRDIFARIRMRRCPRGQGFTASFSNGGCFGSQSLARVGVPDPPATISVSNDEAGRSQLARFVWLYLEHASDHERLRPWDTVFLAETYPVNATFVPLSESAPSADTSDFFASLRDPAQAELVREIFASFQSS
jgi:hypothetical protein